MLRMLFGPRRKDSPAHRMLLSHFHTPRPATFFDRQEDWPDALGETAHKAINRFVKEGLLEDAGVEGRLTYHYKVGELKELLRQRGLPLSGRKAALVARLVEADLAGAREAGGGVAVLQWSTEGAIVVEQYLAAEREKREKREEELIGLLKGRQFRQAAGTGDWATNDLAMLKWIFKAKPDSVSSVAETTLERIRIAAAMTHLLWTPVQASKWLERNQPEEPECTYSVALQDVLSSAHFKQTVAGFGEWVKQIKYRNCNDNLVCEACSDLAAIPYAVATAPALPYSKCTSERCRCWISAVVDSE